MKLRENKEYVVVALSGLVIGTLIVAYQEDFQRLVRTLLANIPMP